VVDEIKSKLVAARQPGIDRAKVQAEVTELQNQLVSIASSAVFSGENWLSVDSSDADYNTTKTIVSSFSRAGDGSISIGTIAVDITATELFDANDQSGILDTESTTTNGAVDYSVVNLDISAFTDTAADLADLEEMIATVDGAIGSITTAASNLGAVKTRVNLQQDFVGSLMDAIERGVGQLVDANMEEESTKLQALQVQQQLGIQALSIANSTSQNILALFR
ncbi:MAG: flagellin, partial [Anderseniella sp.]